MPEWDYRYRARLSFGPNAISGRDPVGFLGGLPVFWKGGPVELGTIVDCAVALGETFGFAVPVGEANSEALTDLGEGARPTAPAAAVRPAPGPTLQAPPSKRPPGLRYRYRAQMAFRENPVPGLDSFGFIVGMRVFWKGPADRLVFGRPIPCAVALGSNYGFAVPLADFEGDVDELEALGLGEPIYGAAFPPPPLRAPEAPAPPSPTRPSVPATRPPGLPAAPPAKTAPPPLPAAPPARPSLPPGTPPAPAPPAAAPPRREPADVQREFLRALEASDGAPLREALAVVADRAAAAVLARELQPVRQLVSVLKKELGDARSDLSQLSRELRSVKRSGRDALAAIPKPAPADPGNPTPEEIKRQIVYQLVRISCWGGKHTSEENFKRGYHAKVDEAKIRRAVKELEREGILRPHGKRPEEHYSLVPESKAAVSRMLGIEEEDLPGPEEATEAAAPVAARPPEPGDFVERASFENSMRSLREEVAKLGSGLRAAMEQSVPRFEVTELAGRVADVEGRLAELQNAVTAQGEQMEAIKELLLRKVPEPGAA